MIEDGRSRIHRGGRTGAVTPRGYASAARWQLGGRGGGDLLRTGGAEDWGRVLGRCCSRRLKRAAAGGRGATGPVARRCGHGRGPCGSTAAASRRRWRLRCAGQAHGRTGAGGRMLCSSDAGPLLGVLSARGLDKVNAAGVEVAVTRGELRGACGAGSPAALVPMMAAACRTPAAAGASGSLPVRPVPWLLDFREPAAVRAWRGPGQVSGMLEADLAGAERGRGRSSRRLVTRCTARELVTVDPGPMGQVLEASSGRSSTGR